MIQVTGGFAIGHFGGLNASVELMNRNNENVGNEIALKQQRTA